MSRFFILILIAFVGVGYLSSCDDDDVEIGFTGEEEEYALFDVDGNSVVGAAWFKEREDGAISVVLRMNDIPAGNSHPAHIHANSAAEGGGIVISLTPVSGDDDSSTTIITQTDDGDPISYQELLAFDGHINVHQSADNMSTLIAQGDIGSNKLTGEAEFYKLFPVSDNNSPDSTIVSFKERVNGETLVEMTYYGNTDLAHPAHIHSGTAVMGGPISISLNDIDLSGKSVTNVSQTDDGTAVTYQELIDYNGHINVHQSASNMATLISQGDIGANEFTGRSKSYILNQVNFSGISGRATFYERQDNTFLAVIELNAPENSSYQANIYEGSTSEGGSIVISLNNVENGLSLTEIDAMDDETSITYDELLNFNGHIKIISDTSVNPVVAQGNIGSNATD
jgi:hypothetical protein